MSHATPRHRRNMRKRRPTIASTARRYYRLMTNSVAWFAAGLAVLALTADRPQLLAYAIAAGALLISAAYGIGARVMARRVSHLARV
jgi:hypothetical protein